MLGSSCQPIQWAARNQLGKASSAEIELGKTSSAEIEIGQTSSAYNELGCTHGLVVDVSHLQIFVFTEY